MATWKLQDAKNRFSELVDKAADEGPQIVSRHGKPAAAVVSFEEYKKLLRPEQNLFEFIQQSPWFGVELELERSKDMGREVDL